jgi:hypothetical protein
MFYLGPYGSPESKRAYSKLKAEWLANRHNPKFAAGKQEVQSSGRFLDALAVDELKITKPKNRRVGGNDVLQPLLRQRGVISKRDLLMIYELWCLHDRFFLVLGRSPIRT